MERKPGQDDTETLRLGLSGGYCVGKNLVASMLEERGFFCIDVDRLGHEALRLSIRQVAARFGEAVMKPDGSPDRQAIGRIVFQDPAALADHEAIVHPVMFSLLDKELALCAERGRRMTCINAAILYKMPQVWSCDAVIEVRSGLEIRLRRAKLRDGLDAREALVRIRRQESLLAAGPGAGAGAGAGRMPEVHILDNSLDETTLARELDVVLERILKEKSRIVTDALKAGTPPRIPLRTDTY